MKLRPLILSSILPLTAMSANAALIAGDVTVIGFRADADDAISFVVWTTVSAGESIHFTDSGFFNDNTLRDSEDVMSWTAPVGGITAGTVVSITSSDSNANGTATIGSATGRLNGFSASGDQVFLGTSAFPDTTDTTKPGSSYGGTLLFGFDFNGIAGWDADTTGTNASALPSALDSLGLNFAIAHVDNGQYTGPRSGLSTEQFKSQILNAANWTTNDDGATFGSLNTTAFTVVPEPASALLGGLGMLCLLRRRR